MGDDWRQRMLDEIATRSRIPRTDPRRGVFMRLYPWMRSLLVDAARKRGISIGAYCRRAVMAMIARDMGEDYYELMRDEPMTRSFANEGKQAALRGHGYGPWAIKELADEPRNPAE